MDADGSVQYVHKYNLRSDALQLFAAPGDEILIAPRGVLCVKSCAPAPLRPIKWFNELEVRCSPGSHTSASTRHERIPSAGGQLRPDQMRNAIDMYSGSGLGSAQGSIASEAVEWLNSVNGVTLQGVAGGQFGRRVCLPLEARYEPMVFSHRRRHQRNLYYRFDVLPLGAKRCCCF